MWYVPWSENIKKRACRYLLQRYLGDYLLQKLTLEQLNVDLYNGTGTVSNVRLDCEALNYVGDKQNWPLEIVDGLIEEITVTIPWSTLFKDHCVVEVHGLTVTVQPKVRAEPASSMLESMWSSMSSSMQLAAECLGEEEVQQETQSVDGIEMFAHAIDSVLSRVKVKFVNTNIRIEHVPINSDRGIALVIHIENINYFDEAGAEPKPEETDPDKCKTFIEATCTNKRIQCQGVTLYTDEFPSKLRTMARSLDKSIISQPETSHIDDINFQSATSDLFYETTSVMTLGNDHVKEVEEPIIKIIEATPEERASQPKPVLFAKLSGEQDLSLKLKHTDELDAPKIELNILLGSFIIFISPRQLHTMTELLNALSQPQLEDTSNVPLRPNAVKIHCKPMKQADFQLIEAQLLGNFQQETVKLTSGKTGWSGPNFDSDADSDKFLPMTSQANQMTESFSSSISSMNTSMHSSFTIPSSQPRKHIRKAVRVEGDPTADVTHISIKIASLTCVLIHKDIILVNRQGFNQVIPSTVEKMRQVSTQYFDNLARYSVKEGGKSNHHEPIEVIEKSTDRSHLRILATDLTVNGSDKVTSHGSQTTCEASAKHVLVQECLYNKTEDSGSKPSTYNIIRFSTKENNEKHSSVSRSNIRVSFKQTAKYMRLAGEKKPDNPETDIVIKCTPVYLDVDLTLMERMSATFFGRTNPHAPSPPPTTHNQFNFTLQCPNLKASLKFPIADMRARDPRINDLRSIRNDYLVFAFQNATISSQKVASIRPQPTTIAVKCTTLDFLYHENENFPATHIARTTMDENCDCDIKCTNPMLPTVSLTFRAPTTNKCPFESEIFDDHFAPVGGNPMTTSMYVLDNLSNAEPSPFSGKKMAHQSIIKARESDSEDAKEEELIIPGTEEEMTGFTDSAVNLSDIHLEFNLPVLSLQLESKQLYEIIYNRINSDLLLWEPNILDEADYNADECGNIYPFDMCKGGYNSDSGSTTSDDEFYANEPEQQPETVIPEKKETHSFCLTFKVNKGLLTIYAPVRDSNKLVVPGQMGELVLEAHKLSLCHVSGINGVSKTGQLCLRAGTMTLYHEAMLSIPSEKPCLRLYGTRLPPHLKKTIYPSTNTVILKETVEKKDMFCIALKVTPDPETANLKVLCTALGVERATLRHRGERGVAWLSQLMDVLDVLDYPVPGYTPSTVVSELHVHLADCAVDYRPLYLPIRTVVILGNFNISNNVIPATNTSCLKFLAQECALFISHIHGAKHNAPVPQDDDKLPNVHKDYVCVIDIGLFELLLRMDDKSNPSKDHPQLELSASNNMVNVYTCWDSATALCHLITYVAADGDSQPPYDRSSRHTSICSDPPTEPLVGLDDRPVEEIRELSPNEIQQVNDLMEEALKESPNTTLEEEDLNSSTDKEVVEVFFFPDESNMKRKKRLESGTENDKAEYEDFCSGISKDAQETKPLHPQVAKDLGVPTTPKATKKVKRKKKSSGSGNNTDDEYCIVEALGAALGEEELDEPQVRWLSAGPLCLTDEHFTAPAARSDVLKAPKNFPLPILRYTLYEMSVTWHLFGGNDFRSASDPAPKKTVTIEDAMKQGSPTIGKRVDYEPYSVGVSEYRAGVRWAAGAERVRGLAARAPPRPDPRTRGGVARDPHVCVKLCLTKVKFQHETYPTSGLHASRQTLAISKIEVIDQLYCSDINKLLTLYKLQDEPDRKNAHMLIVKAVHLRSEPTMSAQECCLKISLLPLRFNLDQDTLAFLVGFFTKLGTEDGAEEELKSVGVTGALDTGSRQTTPTHRPPVMGVASHLRDPPPTPTSLGDGDALSLNDTVNREEGPLLEPYEAERLVSENLIQLEEDFNRLGVSEEKPPVKTQADSEPIDDSPIYFRRVVFSPEVPIRLDYVGKRVDLSAGPVAGLLMGLGHLNCSELTLRRLDYKLGLLGLEKLVQWALHEWLTDIKRHQLPGLLSGIGPMHSLLQLITGIRDLVWMPVEQWRRDGRLVHGLRRGAASFTARTAVAALDITTRLLHLIQATAETAFDMLTPGPTLQLQDAYERRQRRRRRRADPARQPADLRAGVATAYHTVKEGFAETAATIALVSRCESGVSVLRHLPGAAVAPLALAAAGAADVLGGVRAHLAPRAALDDRDKWRADVHHSH